MQSRWGQIPPSAKNTPRIDQRSVGSNKNPTKRVSECQDGYCWEWWLQVAFAQFVCRIGRSEANFMKPQRHPEQVS
jgi:hypothetical protein